MTRDHEAARLNLARPGLVVIAAILIAGLAVRASFLFWDRPWEPHHPDEHILALEAVALWEGITPREVGWPATTTRLALSGISAVKWLVEQGRDALSMRDRPADALGLLTGWIGRQYVDPSGSYRTGRLLSMFTGVLQLAVLAWTLRRWSGGTGVAMAVLALALSPIVVVHSQYVLADITGLFFATLVLARADSPTPRSILLSTAFAALAAASKLHFGIWVLTPVLSILLSRDLTARTRASLLGVVAVVFVWTFAALFPWSWTNPVLAVKEFLGVVAIKVGAAPSSATQLLANLRLLIGSTGMLLWAGALLGVWYMRRSEWREAIAVALPVLLGALVLGRSAIVFDRYGMVLAPGMAVLAAIGWGRALSVSGRALIAARGAATVALIATLMQLIGVERIAGEADVDSLAKAWVMEHVARGSRVAVHDESNALLPRSAAQLRECSAESAAEAYSDKWRMLGYEPPAAGSEPFRLMLLNDEISFAYWCQREREAQTDPGYFVVRYHNDARSNAQLERDVVEEFRSGATRITGGIDALVVNRRLPIDTDPDAVLQTRRGIRVVYVR